jgi:hypothetical protein
VLLKLSPGGGCGPAHAQRGYRERGRSLLAVVRRHAFACGYLAAFAMTQAAYALLPAHAHMTVLSWASTSVANLEHDPFVSLFLSALIVNGNSVAWLALVAVAVFGASRAAGNRRTAVICVAGHVIGTLVSEAIVAYRVDAGQLPPASNHLTDVGPSYLVVSALVLMLARGGPAIRLAAVTEFAVATFAGGIFAGLSRLDVAAVGHVAAIATVVVSEGVAHAKADKVRDARGADAQRELAEGAAPERPAG